MKNTIVINLFGGPGIGKSTLAAELYASLKKKNINCELVREYVKNWAWENKEIKPVNQIFLLGQQAQAESILYGKVDYIITDSPILLPAVYQKLFFSGDYVKEAAEGVMNDAEKMGVTYKNYVLKRTGEFKQEGRYHSLQQSIIIDEAIPIMLIQNKQNYTTLDCLENERSSFITKDLDL